MNKFSFFVCNMLLMIMLFACTKTPVQPDKPVPGGSSPDPSAQRSFRLTLSGLHAGSENTKAVISILNNKDEMVMREIQVDIVFNQKVQTAALSLEKGNYKITGLLIKEGNSVKYASPLAGSEKAALVTHPLSLTFSLDAQTEKDVSVEVVPVTATDKPLQFGYPDGSFGSQTGEQPNTAKKIFIQPLIKVGDIVYDSIPVQLILRSFDAQNNMTYNAMNLPAGLQQVELPANAVKYQLTVSKWGTQDEITLKKEDIQENTVYSIGGNMPAKKLKNVYTNRIVDGVSKPETKMDYTYHANGELKQTDLWVKNEDGSNLRSRTDLYEYTNGKITAIRNYNETDKLIGTSSFTYDAAGRVSTMDELLHGLRKTATVNYIPLETRAGITQDYRIEIQIRESGYTIARQYSKTISGGCVVADNYNYGNGDMIAGIYNCDLTINPYAHLGIPDFYLNQYVKHNVKLESKTYANLFPEYEVYDIQYTYDGNGYPLSIIKKYRNYWNKTEAYSVKTGFTYE
ncbi:MAG: hypothetical protein ACTHMC_21980 [Pseudobacter sp.]|uniref:hypothetical protein n=1 Tax=Pseudobacter sp. TaxID=2045420 RepID=UPI003F802970